jgi:hypothetical protein
MQPPQMPARRTAEEVVAAARAMDQARAAGLPDRLLLVMLAARSAWWGDAEWPPHAQLVEVLMDQRSRIIDEVVFAAIKKRVRP